MFCDVATGLHVLLELLEAADVSLTILTIFPAIAGAVEVARWVTLAVRLVAYYRHLQELKKKE